MLTQQSKFNAVNFLAVGLVSRCMSNPRQEHWKGVMWIIRYIQNLLDVNLIFSGKSVDLEGGLWCWFRRRDWLQQKHLRLCLLYWRNSSELVIKAKKSSSFLNYTIWICDCCWGCERKNMNRRSLQDQSWELDFPLQDPNISEIWIWSIDDNIILLPWLCCHYLDLRKNLNIHSSV